MYAMHLTQLTLFGRIKLINTLIHVIYKATLYKYIFCRLNIICSNYICSMEPINKSMIVCTPASYIKACMEYVSQVSVYRNCMDICLRAYIYKDHLLQL